MTLTARRRLFRAGGVAGALALAWGAVQWGYAGSPPVERRESGEAAFLRYQWTDPNTKKILEWKGDSPVVDPSVPARRLGLQVQVGLPQLKAAVDSFGIPPTLMTIRYKGKEDLRRKQEERALLARSRGFVWNEKAIEVAYDWVVDHGREDVREAAAGLVALARQEGYESARDLSGLFASFVQGMEYRIPERERTNSRGERLYTGGITMPIETLYNGYGDCDTRCALLSSLLANLSDAETILLAGKKHAFIGVRGVPRRLDRYVEIKGISYVLVELTDTWPMGRIPGDNWLALERSEFRVVPLYDNAGRAK